MPRGRPRKNQSEMLIKSAELIGWAIGGIEREISHTRERLAALTEQAAKLRKRAGLKGSAASVSGSDAVGVSGEVSGNGRKRKRRKMSPEARKRISEMMKKNWAERRKAKKA
jgi:hypothetical protein